jgi:glutathionylspermidine synthase
MRALVTTPGPITQALYRRFIRRAELRGLLADHLYEGEPYLALNAIVLSENDRRLLAGLSDTFASTFHKAAEIVARDVPGLVRMGFPWAAAELLAAEPPRMPVLGRFDFVQDQRGAWWLLEYNADTPSGVREAIVADALVAELLPQARSLERGNAGLRRAVVAAFVHSTAALGAGDALGIVTDAGALEDLAQMAFTADLVRPALAERGIDAVLGDVHNLRPGLPGLSLRGRRVAALYRYLPFESLFGSPGFAAVEEASTSGSVTLLNGLYGLLLQHKGLMAWLWAHRDDPRFSPAERGSIRAHLAATWMAGEQSCGLPPSELVFKQVFGREGEEVFFGEDLSEAQVADLVRRQTYVAQRRIHPQALSAAIPTSLGTVAREGYATVGSYVTAGRFAGFYTRFGDKIVTARAKWLATFVEDR